MKTAFLRAKLVAGTVTGGLLACSSFAITRYTWQGGDAANTPTNAYAYNVAANWNPADAVDHGVPGTSSDQVYFAKNDVYTYITNDTAVKVGQWYGYDTSSVIGYRVYISDQPLAICGMQQQNRGGWFYAPLVFADNQVYVAAMNVCGDMSTENINNVLFHGVMNARYDCFANAAGATRKVAWKFAVSGYQNETFIYAPESMADDIKCYFGQTAGSPYVIREGGSRSWAFPAGTLVSGTGIPEGTYLKRVFPNKDWMELSQPVTATVATNVLTFAAFSPKFTLTVDNFAPNASDTYYRVCPLKFRSEDDVRVEAGILTPGLEASGPYTKPFIFGWNALKAIGAYTPATLVIHRSYPADNTGYVLATCDLLFSDVISVQTRGPGLPYGHVHMPCASDVATLCVTGQMTAAIRTLENVQGTLAKTGTGTLVAGLVATNTNTGTIQVKAGTFAIADDAQAASPANIAGLSISAGATLRVPVQGLRVSSFAPSAGAIVEGPGTLLVNAATDLSNVTFKNGAVVKTVLETALFGESDDPTELIGDPAFWVDCSATNKMTFAVDSTETEGVVRIDDVRKKTADDPYNFSTNASAGVYLPRIKFDDRIGRHFVHFRGFYVEQRYSTYNEDKLPAKIHESDTHVWDRPVMNITAVFQVMAKHDAGIKPVFENSKLSGQFLGISAGARVSNHTVDYARYSANLSGNIFDWSTGAKNGALYIDGKSALYSDGYAYGSYLQNNTTYYLVPMVISHQTPSGWALHADSYDYNGDPCYSRQNMAGGKDVCELLVYTNAVSESQRLAITKYLMKKWKNCDFSYGTVQRDGHSLGTVNVAEAAGVTTPADTGLKVDELAGAGVFAKAGAGEVYVEKVTGDDLSLDVTGGTLTVKAVDATAASLPDNPYAHFDAADPGTMTYTVEGGVTNVTAWRANATWSAALDANSTNPPVLRAAAELGGRAVLDFGPATGILFADTTGFNKSASSLRFPDAWRTNLLRTVVAVWGSQEGGGNLVGECHSAYHWNTHHSLKRAGTEVADVSVAIGGDAAQAILGTMERPYTARYARGGRFNLNGTSVDPNKTGFTGGFDLVSYVSYENFGAGALSSIVGAKGRYFGGEKIAEYLLYERGLSTDEIATVEAYLRKKWYGLDTAGFESVAFSNVTIRTGATLATDGMAVLTAQKLTAAGGTVKGSMALAASGGTLEAFVASDGSVPGVTFTAGSLDLSAGGVLSFTGTPAALQPGVYALATGVTGAPTGWTISRTGLAHRWVMSLDVADGVLYLKVAPAGTTLFLR